MNITIDIKNLFYFSLTFILFTIIGTLSHEYGHIIVAKYLGYDTSLSYGSMNYNNPDQNEKLTEIYNENKTAIHEGLDFKQKTEFDKGIDKLNSDSLLITIGGPLQTIVTGTIGLWFILLRRKTTERNGLKLIDWIAVFLSLFWLREVFNLVTSVGGGFVSPVGSYFGGDERYISVTLNLWPGTVSIILAVIGLLISLFIIFEIVPERLRLTFILSGLIGGISGFILWMNLIGPKILP